MAFRGAAISVGRQAHNRTTTCLLLSIPRHLRTSSSSSSSSSYHHVSATANPFKISNQLPQIKKKVRYYSVQGTSGTAVQPVTQQNNYNKVNEEEDPSSQNWKIKMLYDGECPLCMREVDMLRERNKTYGTIKFVDISSDEYSDKDNQGLDYKTVMGRIHAILSDGTVVTDVEAFRKLYEAVGLGWVYAITKYEPIASIANAVYGFWAKYRLQVTGRPPLEEVLEVRRKKQTCGDSKDCKI